MGLSQSIPVGMGCLACDSILEVLTGLQQTLSSELSSLQTLKTQRSMSKAGWKSQQRVLGLLILLTHLLHSRGKAHKLKVEG